MHCPGQGMLELDFFSIGGNLILSFLHCVCTPASLFSLPSSLLHHMPLSFFIYYLSLHLSLFLSLSHLVLSFFSPSPSLCFCPLHKRFVVGTMLNVRALWQQQKNVPIVRVHQGWEGLLYLGSAMSSRAPRWKLMCEKPLRA